MAILLLFLRLPDAVGQTLFITFIVIHILPSWALIVRQLHNFKARF